MTLESASTSAEAAIRKIIGFGARAIENDLWPTSSISNQLCVALVGSPMVGKSSLFNALLGEEIAEVSNVPMLLDSTTEGVWANLFRLLDSPSYDPDALSQQLVQNLSSADVVIQVCDLEATVRRTDRQLAAFVQKFGKPYVAVVNKVDVYRDRSKRSQHIERAQRELSREVLSVSALEGEGLVDVVVSIIRTQNEINCQDILDRLFLTSRKIEEYGRRVAEQTARYNSCMRIINSSALQAAQVGSNGENGQAILLALQLTMIDSIFGQFPSLHRNTRVKYPLGGRIEFFLNALAQEVGRLPDGGKLLASTHAQVWITEVGKCAYDFFEQQIDDEQVSNRIKVALDDLGLDAQ